MKQYKKLFFSILFFILINSIFMNAQNVGYIRIIDNSDKNNDYKDCQYNRFDDLLISNMKNQDIKVLDYSRKTVDVLLSSCDKVVRNIDVLINSKGSKKLFNKFKDKTNLDYLIVKQNNYKWDNFIAGLNCGTDFINDCYSTRHSCPDVLSYMIFDLNNCSSSSLILNFYKNTDFSLENFNDKTNLDNFIKDIKDIIKKFEVKAKNYTENFNLIENSEMKNNNSVSDLNNFSNPRIMVLPKKIEEKNYQNGDYYLKKEEKMIIASLKKVLEDNKIKTIGFESVIKNISERRLLQSGTKVDLKTLILESNESDFYVEFENLGSNEKTEAKSNNQSTLQSNQNKNFEVTEVSGDEFSLSNQNNGTSSNNNYGNCPQSFDFKIRNYATSEDIASDLQEINTCGSVDEYKKFANKILNYGAISKIKNEFQYLIENGKKVSLFFSFSESSNRKFDDKIQGIRISQHIEKCIKENSFNGKFILGGVVNNYMSFPQVAIPFIDKNNGQTYTTSQFSNIIRDYLENYLEVKEVTVTGSSINFIIN